MCVCARFFPIHYKEAGWILAVVFKRLLIPFLFYRMCSSILFLTVFVLCVYCNCNLLKVTHEMYLNFDVKSCRMCKTKRSVKSVCMKMPIKMRAHTHTLICNCFFWCGYRIVNWAIVSIQCNTVHVLHQLVGGRLSDNEICCCYWNSTGASTNWNLR